VSDDKMTNSDQDLIPFWKTICSKIQYILDTLKVAMWKT